MNSSDNIQSNDSPATQSSEISNIPNDPEMRARFYATFHPYQNWSLPGSIIYYILKNPSTSHVYQKLTKSCKYFFIKNPYLICQSLYYDGYLYGWGTVPTSGNLNKISFQNVSTKLWIGYEFNISSSYDRYIASAVIPKIGKCNVTTLSLNSQILSSNDLKVFTSTVDFITFVNVIVKNENGTTIEVQKIVEMFPIVKWFQYFDDLNASCITSITFKELEKIQHFKELEYFSLNNVPEDFDIETFYVYMKKNKHTAFNIDFQCNPNLSEAYKTRLESIVDEIVDAEEHDFKVPYIPFNGIGIEKCEKLIELNEKQQEK